MGRKRTFLSVVLTMAIVMTNPIYCLAEENEAINTTTQEESVVEMTQETEPISINDEENFELNEENIDAEETLKVEDNKAETEELVEDVSDAEEIIETEEELEEAEINQSNYLYTTVSGTLGKPGDYSLLPLELTKGDYLQAKMVPPNEASVDYDLRLYDENFNLLAVSDYATVMLSGDTTIDESIGYVLQADMQVYVCVISTGNGSTSAPFSLDIAVTRNSKDMYEVDETAVKAATIEFVNYSGGSITRNINSPIDSDWYVFNVEDSPAYNKMRIGLTNNSPNGCKLEIYQNVLGNSSYYGMIKIGEGSGGELKLPAGQYYARIVGNSPMNSFDATNIGSYTFSIEPVGRVDEISITYIDGAGREFMSNYFPEGNYYKIAYYDSTYMSVIGQAYYLDEKGERHPSPNAMLHGLTINHSQLELGNNGMAYANGTGYTDNMGNYKIFIPLIKGVGLRKYTSSRLFYFYDFMDIKVNSCDNLDINTVDHFYMLIYARED